MGEFFKFLDDLLVLLIGVTVNGVFGVNCFFDELVALIAKFLLGEGSVLLKVGVLSDLATLGELACDITTLGDLDELVISKLFFPVLFSTVFFNCVFSEFIFLNFLVLGVSFFIVVVVIIGENTSTSISSVL